MQRQEAERLLKQHFHLDSFYDRQWEAIDRLLRGQRVLLIEKTGYGKSLCYQFPAIFLEGVTVIFSPLIALMRDQVNKLNALNIPARCINSEQVDEENSRILDEAYTGKLKILYIAPERQENSEWIAAAQGLKLAMVVVDEAHCISVWGHDFRPAFRRIINLVHLLPKGLPILATTATATPRVEKDVASQIGSDFNVLRGNLLRENFKLRVIKTQSEDEKMIWLAQHIEELPGSGIIYTGTRANTEIYSRWFDYLNISAMGYNAGMDAESRKEIEFGLMNNRWKCIISTNALGMGIDKPDIRFIIHTQMPQSPIHYYQEIGRAGRDGTPADIILFSAPDDRELPVAFIEGAKPDVQKYWRVIRVIRSQLLTEKEILKETNVTTNQFRIIKADLMDQKIIRTAQYSGLTRYEYIPGAPEYNYDQDIAVRKAKYADLDAMAGYIECRASRMKYLCDYLGDSSPHIFNNCDNTGLEKFISAPNADWKRKVAGFHENFFPELKVESRFSNLINGVAASYYGATAVGTLIHNCKYNNGGEFPALLVEMTVKAIKKKFKGKTFDCIVYVSPSISGDLVKNFAVKIAAVLNIPIDHNLRKVRSTKEQKIFNNSALKTSNVKDAFEYLHPMNIMGKNIMLIDDIYDSGATIKEIGKYLTGLGVNMIAPVTIAKTVAGDLK